MSVSSSTPFGAARDRQHGQVLVLFAFVLIALLLVSALAIDYGGWLLARRTYQNVADEAALAGSYQLTSPTGADCNQGVGVSKQTCAREAAWTAIQNHIGLPAGASPSTLGDSSADSLGGGGAGVVWDGWRVWVASPPSDAGSYYTGFASSNKTIFVRIERTLDAGLSRIIQSSTTVGAWATAGRIPENFAILTLCQSRCLAGDADLQVAGNGSNLILESGDLGSNSYGKTSGSDASIALCQGDADSSQCSAYMHTPSQCTVGSSTCQLDAWDGTAVDKSTRYSAIALPQVVDPLYRVPTLSDTRSGGVVTGTTPYQCYAATDSVPGVAMAPGDEHFAVNDPFGLVAAHAPRTEPPVVLGLWPPSGTGIDGQVTDASTSAGVNGITVTATDEASAAVFTTTTAKDTGVDGRYAFTGLVAGHTYRVQAHDSSIPQAYGDLQYSGNSVSTNVMAVLNFSLTPNPGTITGSVTGVSPLSGITITFSGAGAATATTDPAGTYSISLAAGTYTLSPSVPTGYSVNPTSTNVTLPAGGSKAVPPFVYSVVPTGSIAVTVKDQTTGLLLTGATVTASNGTTTYTPTSSSGGVYTFSSVPISNPKYTVTVALQGYANDSNATQANIAVSAGTTTPVPINLWPANCGKGGHNGEWNCDTNTTGTGCTTVTNPTAINVGCSSYDNSNRIRPGTYSSITIGNGECAWIDPLGGTPGLTTGQSGGVVYITGQLDIGSDAFLLGDGVTIVLASGAFADVGNGGGFVINYGGANCDPVPGTSTSCSWRTANYIGNNTGTPTWLPCATDTDGFADLRRGAFTTGGTAQVARLTWDTSGTPCYQDGSTGAYQTTNKGEIGIAWYLRGEDTSPGSHRFAFSSTMGFLFDGVLYGPKDNIDLGGQGAQAAAGQIVGYTLKYHGDTDIHQRYSGLEIDGPPYLIEPYIGE